MQTHKRASGIPPSPVTMAEWVNAGSCPTEALHEAGRLFVDLKLASLRAELGTDVRWWARGEGYRPALDRVEVNADSIVFQWREERLLEGWDANPKTDRSGMSDWWNSRPFGEDPIPTDRSDLFKVDWNELPRQKRSRDIKRNSSLGTLVGLWDDTPETIRPAHFPLDPVVGALVGSRVSLRDYMPTFRRYQQDVRRAVDKDEEMNGQDVHDVLLESMSPDSEKHDLLIGLLRAGAGPLEKDVGERIKNLIPKLGTLDDVNHGRVVRAFDYAVGSNRSNSADWRGSYDKARRDAVRSEHCDCSRAQAQ